jgi:hypothetical protein
MALIPSIYCILTLQTSLDEVMRLGDNYRVSEGSEEWRASDLLAWLQEHHPDLLSLPVALVPPDSHRAGAVFEVDEEGRLLTYRRLYRIERRRRMDDHAEAASHRSNT